MSREEMIASRSSNLSKAHGQVRSLKTAAKTLGLVTIASRLYVIECALEQALKLDVSINSGK